MPTKRAPITRALRLADHLALFAGLDPAGALLAAAQIGGRAHPFPALPLACAWATGSSVYLLDRVKLADRFLDRADLAAKPDRFAWIRAHARAVRLFGALLALTALILAALVHPAAAVLVLAGHAAVVAYAHRSADPARRARPKDILVLKNALVGAGIAFFAVALLALASTGASPGLVPDLLTPAAVADLLVPFVFLSLSITADAALSDIDDVPTDRPFGTRTLPAAAGPRATILAFLLTNIVAGAALAAWAALTDSPPGRGLLYAWAALAPLTALGFALPKPRLARSLRPLIDARLPLLAAFLALAPALT
jgi:4-hydroxybenzoate polyprenyltransferase